MKYQIFRPVFFLVLVAVFPMLDLLQVGLPETHDGQDHIARIANFYQSFREGNIIPRWASNLNWGYGHPILIFLYPLPSYLAAMFHCVGFTLVDSTKLVFITTYIASIIAMYIWANLLWGRTTAVICALLYGFAPYRFVDLYVRGAIGEHVAFIFPPLVLASLYLLAKGMKKYMLLLSLSLAGLILSHNAISLMFIPIFILYAIYLYRYEAIKFERLFLIHMAVGFLFGLGLSAFFWIPALLEGKYTLRNIVIPGTVHARFVPLYKFFVFEWNYGQGNEFTKSIGLVQLFGLLFAVYKIIHTKTKVTRVFLYGSFIVLFLSIFMMLDISVPIWANIQFLQNFQFPWRFMTIVVFVAATIAGWSLGQFLENVSKTYKIPKVILVILATICIFLSTFQMWHSNKYIIQPESFYTGIYNGTTDTGESSPIWSVRFMETRPKNTIDVISGKADILLIKRNTTQHEYYISSPDQSKLVENTLYFPGWSVYVDSKKIPIEFQNPLHRGLMTFSVEPGIHTIDIKFSETKLRLVSVYISMTSLVIVLFLHWIDTGYNRRNLNK